MSVRKRGESEKDKVKLNKQNLNRALQIFGYVLPYKWPFILGMFFLSAGSLLFLAIMSLPGEILNIISGNPTYPLTLNQVFLFLLVLLGVQGVFSYLRVWLFTIVSERSMANLRKDLYQQLITLGIPFLEKRRVGEVTSRITNDVTQVQSVVSITLAEFLRQIIIFLGAIVIIIFKMKSLALTMLLTFPVVVLLAMFFGRHIRKLVKKRQDQLADSNVVVEETMQNIQTVKAYTYEWVEISRYQTNLEKVVRIALKAAHMRGLFAAFIIFVMFGALFFVMWRAAIMVQNGAMLQGDLVNFIVYTGLVGASIASIGSFYTEIVAAVGATDRILDILDTPAEVQPKENITSNTKRFEGNISYDQVHFSYPSRKDVPVIQGLSFDIKSGQKIALVGGSGAGKSTIIQLLLQFYNIDAGEIRIDDRSIYEYDLLDYRRNLAIVPQEVLLFGGTIRENILYGRPDASSADIIDAAQKANAWEFIQSFPEGLNTIVGERGVKLSGGQRQRIAIARAILKDPAILLLDEATSSLDAESEKLVQDALNTLMVGRTSIIIAHRLATIRDVDCIFVIEGGQIVEQGTHEALSAIPDGAYNTLAKLQFDLIE
ncbi:MAG: ATP-binding cassette domain-containing protein [Saprospiraceae bacterium]|nr:ATP-binding cassette domain-containing protein [Saprospiraceae bacterium]